MKNGFTLLSWPMGENQFGEFSVWFGEKGEVPSAVKELQQRRVLATGNRLCKLLFLGIYTYALGECVCGGGGERGEGALIRAAPLLKSDGRGML